MLSDLDVLCFYWISKILAVNLVSTFFLFYSVNRLNMLLVDIVQVKTGLKIAKADKIKLLHQLVFTTDKNSQNRVNLRIFTVFQFQIDDDAFTAKLRDITDKFSKLDRISIFWPLT